MSPRPPFVIYAREEKPYVIYDTAVVERGQVVRFFDSKERIARGNSVTNMVAPGMFLEDAFDVRQLVLEYMSGEKTLLKHTMCSFLIGNTVGKQAELVIPASSPSADKVEGIFPEGVTLFPVHAMIRVREPFVVVLECGASWATGAVLMRVHLRGILTRNR